MKTELTVCSIDQFGPPVCIVNSDLSTGQGKHWTARYHEYLFDSYGFPPDKRIADGMKTNRFYSNGTRIQDADETNCGWYCLQFLILMERSTDKKKTFETIAAGKSKHMTPESYIPPGDYNSHADTTADEEEAKQSPAVSSKQSLTRSQKEILPAYRSTGWKEK